jgi:hypothetical protein
MRHYFHGDENEDDPSKIYCAKHDLFATVDHFDDSKEHPTERLSDYDRYEIMRKNFAKSKTHDPKQPRTRPSDAKNIFA